MQEELPEVPDALRARERVGLRVVDGERAIADDPVRLDLEALERLAEHRLDGVAPQLDAARDLRHRRAPHSARDAANGLRASWA